MRGYARDLNEEIPGYANCTSRLRNEQTVTTRHMLLWAALTCLIRAALVPWVLYYNYDLRTLQGPTDMDIVSISVLCLCIFLICQLWAKFSPILASMVAIAAFGTVTAYDVMTYENVIDWGITGKIVIWILLLRAFMNSILSRTM